MRTTVSVDPRYMMSAKAMVLVEAIAATERAPDYERLGLITDMQAALRKREIAEQAASRAAFLIRNDECEQATARGPRNRAERRRAAALGRC